MTTQLETIVQLQTALDELRAARQLLGGIPESMGELHEEYSQRKQEIDDLEAVVEEARQERRAAEDVVSDSQERLKRFQEQIGLVRNQREYGALLQEIDAVKELIRSSEERGLAALERQDQAQQPIDELREAFKELDQRYQAELVKWEAEKPSVAESAKKLEQRIEVLRERLPANVLALFDRIFERYDGRALAEIQVIKRGPRQPQIWHCGGCNYRVRPQAIVQIQNDGSVVECDSCKRILFIAEATA